MDIWARIDAVTDADPVRDFNHAMRGRVAFSYAFLLTIMPLTNAALLYWSGEGRPGMMWVGLIAGLLAMVCGLAGILTRNASVTMVLILIFSVLVYAASIWGNRGGIPPSAVYLPGVVLGFYHFWGPRSLLFVLPLLGVFFAGVFYLYHAAPEPVLYPVTAFAYAVGFACLWLIGLGSMYRAAARDANQALARAYDDLQTALHAAGRANRAKSEFLANMGHEIRTPLNAILGMTSVLSREGDLNPTQAERLGLVEDAGGTLLELLNEVLDLSKIEAGAMHVEARPFDLPALVQSASATWQEQAVAKGLAFTVRIEPLLSPRLLGDTLRLRQVLGNLLSNAVKFTAHGSIRVEVSQRAGDSEAPLTVIEVIDTGPGIAEDKQVSVFEPFSQADTSTTRNYGGTGLGLAICNRLVELMQGELNVYSRPGHGCRFEILLPLAPALSPPGAQPHVQADDGTRLLSAGGEPVHILIVDDVATNRVVLSAMLHQAFGPRPHEIVSAASGPEAVDACRERAFALVLMDIQMPGMDGITATRLIRSTAPVDGTRFIAVTALSDADTDASDISGQFDAVLAKPVVHADLLDVLETQLAAAARPPGHEARAVR
ncbi:ATP-binding protein [Maricaulis sp. CAU 1757]